MDETQTVPVLVTLVIYKIVLIGIGVWSRHRTGDETDFYLGGRRLGPVVAAISASASSSSAWTLLGVSGAAYAWGLSAVWILPACVGGFVFNWYVLAPRLRELSARTNAVTATDVLAGGASGRAAKVLRVSASILIVLSFVTYVAAQFQGAGKAFHETFGISMEAGILTGAAIVAVYTVMGGFWAVSLTDTLQGLVMSAVALLLPLVALSAVGGPGALLAGLDEVPVDGYRSFTRNTQGPAALGFVAGLLGIGLGYPGQPHVVNRFMALRDDEGSMRRARRVAVTWAVLVFGGMLLVGFAGRVLGQQIGDKEVILVSLANHLLHPVVTGVVLAAVLSAIMSTADSQLLVVASSITHDLSPSHDITRARGSIVLVCVTAAAAALVGNQEIFSRVLFAWTALGNAFGPILIFAAFGRCPRPLVALAAMWTGFLLSVGAHLMPATNGGVFERILPFAVGLSILALASGRGRESG